MITEQITKESNGFNITFDKYGPDGKLIISEDKVIDAEIRS